MFGLKLVQICVDRLLFSVRLDTVGIPMTMGWGIMRLRSMGLGISLVWLVLRILGAPFWWCIIMFFYPIGRLLCTNLASLSTHT